MNNPKLINPYQPERPRHDPETGEVLLYRTRPKRGKYNFHIHTYGNQLAMLSLYRAVCRGEVPQQVAINDLYQWLTDGEFGKRNLGTVVVNAVIYEPRKLYNNRSVGKPTSSYVFRNMLDLQYGLEWMICTWFRKYINKTAPADEQINSRGDMAEELRMLAESTDDEFREVYVSDLMEFMMEPVDWHEQAKLNGWTWEEVLPEEAAPKKKPRTPPRDLSLLNSA
ncbi:MAG: hypothetical protein Unbinned200contig1000_78 [Prokaryotic dsDNA virus sp.]|jgi:hypothetical protein|nr:MAG: hypothetical protein Unbinned200contig1000_78 [Prokaryotic dsDNA virus sp.]|tara:strand:- start:10547 stop:11218 length:672 start_codon:yes stop_codon:yes gene_type:complete